MHRKNSLFYKTETGARTGDAFMSLIHTADLNHAQPSDFLVALQRNHALVEGIPMSGCSGTMRTPWQSLRWRGRSGTWK